MCLWAGKWISFQIWSRCGVTFGSEVVVFLLPGFIVFHLLKLEGFLEREWVNSKHRRAHFALVPLCLCRGERPEPASLPCPRSIRPSWTTAGCQDIGKLWWPGRLMLGPIIRLCYDKARFCVFWIFPLGNAVHQNPVFCNIKLVGNSQVLQRQPSAVPVHTNMYGTDEP